jgi:hypothetical protein
MTYFSNKVKVTSKIEQMHLFFSLSLASKSNINKKGITFGVENVTSLVYIPHETWLYLVVAFSDVSFQIHFLDSQLVH